MEQTNPQNPSPAPKPDEAYWQDVKNLGIAAFSAAIGDPEALKTVVDVLTNATVKGLEHLNLKDAQKEEIKKNFETSMNHGADGIISALSKFQQASQESNVKVRAKYGRKKA